MNFSNWLIIIPARENSSRLEKKLLQDLGGKPVIYRVWENLANLSKAGAEIIVATDSQNILSLCESHSITAKLTDTEHHNGTSRCAEVARQMNKPLILNVQGDEPFLNIKDLERLMIEFEQEWEKNQKDTAGLMGTLRIARNSYKEFFDPNLVKVVGFPFAKYFSRAPIPWPRDFIKNQEQDEAAITVPPFFTHIGVYAYDRDTLLRVAEMEPSPLEQLERLEQLTPLENGVAIKVVTAKHHSIGIDTKEDLEEARKHYNSIK